MSDQPSKWAMERAEKEAQWLVWDGLIPDVTGDKAVKVIAQAYARALATGPVTVRWLRHGEAPEDGETVEDAGGHHRHHARLAWRRDDGQGEREYGQDDAEG